MSGVCHDLRTPAVVRARLRRGAGERLRLRRRRGAPAGGRDPRPGRTTWTRCSTTSTSRSACAPTRCRCARSASTSSSSRARRPSSSRTTREPPAATVAVRRVGRHRRWTVSADVMLVPPRACEPARERRASTTRQGRRSRTCRPRGRLGGRAAWPTTASGWTRRHAARLFDRYYRGHATRPARGHRARDGDRPPARGGARRADRRRRARSGAGTTACEVALPARLEPFTRRPAVSPLLPTSARVQLAFPSPFQLAPAS